VILLNIRRILRISFLILKFIKYMVRRFVKFEVLCIAKYRYGGKNLCTVKLNFSSGQEICQQYTYNKRAGIAHW
jgi:hypothetical protein